jgi:hypothetical protein
MFPLLIRSKLSKRHGATSVSQLENHQLITCVYILCSQKSFIRHFLGLQLGLYFFLKLKTGGNVPPVFYSSFFLFFFFFFNKIKYLIVLLDFVIGGTYVLKEDRHYSLILGGYVSKDRSYRIIHSTFNDNALA